MKSPPIRLGRSAALLLVAFLLGNAVVSAWALYSRFEQTNRNRIGNANIWHAVICDIEKQIKNDNHAPRPTDAQKRQYLRFYDHLLVADAHAQPCNITIPARRPR
jgi:hypothetical protein